MRTLSLLAVLLCSFAASAQYTPAAGQNAPEAAYVPLKTSSGEYERDDRGQVQYRRLEQAPGADTHGNAAGNQYDLAIDGAFEGQTVLIIDQVHNTLVNTRAALREKGLASVVYPGRLPEIKELKEALAKSCQVWLISTMTPQLEDAHIRAIKEFFDAGHGVYIWGDNDPLYADANRLANALVPGLGMKGDVYGDNVMSLARGTSSGVAEGHLITTGLQHLYEGVTIATLHFRGEPTDAQRIYSAQKLEQPGRVWREAIPAGFTPLVYGSAGNLVSAAYEKDGKRLVVDGGFTRLAVSWDDAGTARFVKNAASWLVNSERFADKVAQN